MARLTAVRTPVFSSPGKRVICFSACLFGCTADTPAATPSAVIDDVGRAVPLAPAPARIVSLLPSATELIVRLAAADRLVARTGWDDGAAVAHLPDLGRTLAPGLEAVVGLRPDLVITGPDVLTGGLAARLSEAGVRTYEFDAQRVDAVLSTVTRLSALLGLEAEGVRLRRRIERELDAARGAAVVGKGDAGAPPRVLYLVWHAPPHVAGGGTYVGELIAWVGAENVFGHVDGWADASLEAVLALDPDVVLIATGGERTLRAASLAEAPGWRHVRAVREGRVVELDGDLLERPGVRLAEAARALAAGIRSAQRDRAAGGAR